MHSYSYGESEMCLCPKPDSLYLSSDDEKDDSEGFRESSALGRPELRSRKAHVQKKMARVNRREGESAGGWQRTGGSSDATLSLEGFEPKYLDRRHKAQNRHNCKSLPSSSRGSRSSSRSHEQSVVSVVLWLEHTSKLKVVLVGCILGLVCAMVCGELQLRTLSKGESMSRGCHQYAP